MKIEPGTICKVKWRGETRTAVALAEVDEHNEVQFVMARTGTTASQSADEDFATDKAYTLVADDIAEIIGMAKPAFLERILRNRILALTERHYEAKHGVRSPFVPGRPISYGGRFFDERELRSLVDASLDFWLTNGRYTARFERELAKFLGVRYSLVTNSGSSANLLAFSALTSPMLKERRIRKGDEVITVAASFPTTVNPIVQYGAVPVFVDIDPETYNIDASKLREALSGKTKAVMIAHTMGNPFDLRRVRDFCDKHRLWLIEDNCDALGSKYFYDGEWRLTGTIGHLGTSSFYPPHHITMGEGGAVYTNDPLLKRAVESFRDWGRDCWCASGRDNTCKRRFSQQFGELPEGYDHKYVYTHFGYNLKITDMQAAVGCAQLEKLAEIVEARKRNWKKLHDGLQPLTRMLQLPKATPNSDPSWFGFLLTVKEAAPFTRDRIVRHLESKGIQTRMLFAGNLLRQPLFDEMRASGQGYRVVGDLANTDVVMNRSFWLGVYPGLTDEEIDYVIAEIRIFAEECSSQ
ncbi:lipopolysaccharide biosynthesis protein RfbH [Paenibacillaceae bacterium WGS1546]|uniref:lipopolysaccharide biosynthesis protein RfbH n=1 Tax=Cohnella sp. WGS1546 TaxID=3366810 RepID=UPI00372D84FA